jgi:hypothetical protein
LHISHGKNCGFVVSVSRSCPKHEVGTLARVEIPKYEFGMKSVAKVAISLPVETLQSLERVRARLRKTRSGAVTEAVERWLQAEEVGDDERRYLEGYLRHPERIDEARAVAGAVVVTWESWE